MSSYDLVIIGGGPGGYNAAIRAGQLGLRTAVIERCATLGGTCLNVGCIPSKSLLHASSLFEQAGRDFASLGIEVAPRLNLPAMMKQKEEAVAQLTRGVAFLLKKNKVDWVNGAARLLGAGRLEAKDQAGEVQVLEAGSILIASGSVPARLAGIEVDGERIVDSTGALSFSEVPRRLAVIGAGIIGLELGSVWRRLGSEVVVLEYLDRVTPGIDAEIASQLQRALIRQGMAFRLGVRVQGAMRKGEGVEITFSPTAKDGDEGKAEKIEAERVLLAVGRSPNTEGLGLEALGIATDSRGFIETEAFRTSAPGVFAIGDVTRGPMLAHKAEDEAVACVELLAGRAGFADPEVIPSVIY
ncbi:MAG: dihydrolipoyl dehydrogenase family protein, partial [Caulobacteraceae bacterium]